MENKFRKKRETVAARKSVIMALTVMPSELLAIRVIQKTSKLSFSSLVRYLINEGLKSLMTLTSMEIVRKVLQHEAEREIASKDRKPVVNA